MSASKAEILQHEWNNLVRRDGAKAWTEAADRARGSSHAYGWWTLAFILLTAVSRFLDATGSVAMLAYILNFLVVFWVALQQDAILPFIPTSKATHYLCAILLAFLGCAGWLVWLIQSGNINRACQNVQATIQNLANDPKELHIGNSMEGGSGPASRALRSPEAFDIWMGRLDAHLTELGAVNRHSNYNPGALRYGFIHRMSPQEFLRIGYRESMTEGEFAKLLNVEPAAHPVMLAPDVAEPQPSEGTASPETSDGTPPTPQAKEAPQHNPAKSDLDSLFDLYNSGAITVQEFTQLRSRLDNQSLGSPEGS